MYNFSSFINQVNANAQHCSVDCINLIFKILYEPKDATCTGDKVLATQGTIP